MTKRAVCPNCGCTLKPGAVACPECGSDENTGWKDPWGSEHPDISPFDEEDYRDLHHKEFGNSSGERQVQSKKRIQAVLIGILLVSLAMLGVCRGVQ